VRESHVVFSGASKRKSPNQINNSPSSNLTRTSSTAMATVAPHRPKDVEGDNVRTVRGPILQNSQIASESGLDWETKSLIDRKTLFFPPGFERVYMREVSTSLKQPPSSNISVSDT
jgi:hypothetical protein